MTFLEKLREAMNANNSYVCVGLDSDYDKLPQEVRSSKDPQGLFNKQIIEATQRHVSAYKINIAFYECRGAEGWRSLENTIKAIPGQIPVIIDAKRGDIGSTSAKYAQAVYEHLRADAVTVNPYLGFDSIEPFLKYPDKCAFVLCHTSNQSAEEFQHQRVLSQESKGKFKSYRSTQAPRLFEVVAQRVREWNRRGSCGLVVGANVPEHLTHIMELAPGLPLLIPGIGAQKGSAKEVVSRLKGADFIINSSRAIIFASSGDDFVEAAVKQTIALKEIINDILSYS